ncbi:MAG: hypothetical protein GY710_01580 [Desulfobacteraceae bacterium]|nr:hypothetical protein [Desulfobacteraceae bacterium]
MSELIFNGIVWPPGTAFFLKPGCDVQLKSETTGDTYPVRLSCEKGNFNAVLSLSDETGTPTHELVGDIKNKVQDAMQAFLDVYGFTEGLALSVIIQRAQHDNAQIYNFLEGLSQLKESIRRYAIDPKVLMTLAGQHPAIRLALCDLRNALCTPVDTGFFCRRALEHLLKEFGLVEKPKTSSKMPWEQLSLALRVNDASLKQLQNQFAAARRHGRLACILGSERIVVMDFSWQVVARCAVYLDQGRADLSGDNYELLEIKN